MKIKVSNDLTESSEKSFLSHSEVAGTNVLRWKNPNAFSASWAIQIGETGEEQSEIALLGASTPSGTAGTLTANTLYAHPADTPLYAIKYDKIIFKKSTSGTAGTATPITNGTITIQADSPYTQFDDTTGATTDAWKTCFYSSVLGTSSDDSDWITSSGYSFYSLAELRSRARSKLWNSKFVSDEELDDWINEWKDELSKAAVEVNEGYSVGTAEVAYSGTADRGTISSSDFKGKLDRVWMSSSSGTVEAVKMDLQSDMPNAEYSDTYPRFYLMDENVLVRRPNDVSGTAQIVYPKLSTRLVNDTDELPVIMRDQTVSFIKYCRAQSLYKDDKDDRAEREEGKAYAFLNDFKKSLVPRNRTGPTMIEFVEEINCDDGWY